MERLNGGPSGSTNGASSLGSEDDRRIFIIVLVKLVKKMKYIGCA